MSLNRYFDDPNQALIDLVGDPLLSKFIRDGDFPELVEDGAAAVPLSMSGASKVIERILSNLKIRTGKIKSRWPDFLGWVCDSEGFDFPRSGSNLRLSDEPA